jgi:hypothetical protein
MYAEETANSFSIQAEFHLKIMTHSEGIQIPPVQVLQEFN